MEIEITEKRRKLDLLKALNSLQQADEVLVRMEGREKAGEKRLEKAFNEATEASLKIIDEADRIVALLLGDNESDLLLLLDYYNRNPPSGKTKKHRTDNGEFGEQTESEKRKIGANEKIYNAAIAKAIELEVHAATLKDKNRIEELHKCAALIRSIFTRSEEEVTETVINFEVDRKLLKDLDPEIIVEIGGEFIPQKDKFIVQYNSGLKYDFIKSVKKLYETLTKYRKDSAA